MNISILNEGFLEKQDLHSLRELGNVTTHQGTNTEEMAIDRLRDADIAVAHCYTTPLNKRVLESATALKFIALCSTGYDAVDVEAARAKGILVANVPGFSTEAVAEHAIALMLAVSKKIPDGDATMRNSPFEIDPSNEQHQKYMGFNLSGKTLGIVGFGNIGSQVARIAEGFGMKVVAYNRSQVKKNGVSQVTLDELLKTSDIVSLHLPLSSNTENIIGEEQFRLMKSSAILINTARGKCVDESALINALQTHEIAGAGLDTIVNSSPSNPLLKLNTVVLSPHSAFFTKEASRIRADIIVKNIRAFAGGQAINVV